MTEEAIFAEALKRSTPLARAAYLDDACAGDAELRQRVETLLRSHEIGGDFLRKPASQCAAEELAGQACDDNTRGELPANGDDVEALDFLAPSGKPDSLGRLGHYEILEVIGRGGMGVVLRAFDEDLHRVVAIKVMAHQLATNATARKRFKREAQAVAAVTHDHIVTIHAVEEANGLPYLVMHYIAGLSLQQRLDRDGPLELQEILRIGMQAASGLAAAHAQGLVHRDIKPANILLENGVERVKITDFGLARAAADASLTQSGMVAGTPQFMSPEQAEGKAIDSRSDLFSLGSVLYAMCTGRAPFRGSGAVAVLKRVCEETPAPIRQVNPAIPDWLVEIIDKLHAKDPVERFESAADVAELLSQHLAHVQHPSVVGQVSSPSPQPKAKLKTAPRRRLAVAAAVLLSLVAGVSLTEATGVTKLRATVIRIFTPDGTLVVETDDPTVKVMIEGDGGLVITGAGLEEIRLRPGSYKIHAERDGKKVLLERELVSIARGGREIIRVKLETPPAPVLAKTEKDAFVLLAASKERKFDTLADSVVAARNGDTIEIRGNGPFVSQPIKITQALSIRSGVGFRPVIQLDPEAASDGANLLESLAPLILEGLELQREPQAHALDKRASFASTIILARASLHVANCRLMAKPPSGSPVINFGPDCELRNCEIISSGAPGIGWHYSPHARLHLDNCCIGSWIGINLNYLRQDRGVDYTQAATVRMTRNTFVVGHSIFMFTVYPEQVPKLWTKDPPTKPTQCETEGNIFDARQGVVVFFQAPPGKILSSQESEESLPQVLTWHGARNLYAVGAAFLKFHVFPDKDLTPANPIQSLAEWGKYWGNAEAGSIEGAVRYQGGDLVARRETAPEKLTAEDFRLSADSAGYRAGKDGKDLSADVDLVGPGAAYERWKKTPAYQQWLKDTGQIKK